MAAVRLLPLALLLASTSAKPPIVLVPGLAGSVFRVKLHGAPEPHFFCSKTSDWFTTWVNAEQLIPEQKDCLLARVHQYFDAANATYHDAPGVTLDTNVDFGGVGGIAYLDPSLKIGPLDYYSTMITYFERMGYEVGRDLHGAPYDWRAAPDGHMAGGAYFDKLQALIENTTAANGARAHVVTHSLGGTTFLGFVKTRAAGWVQKHIASFVPISSPWGGATVMALSDVSGSSLGIPLIPQDYLRSVQSTAASGVFVLPTEAAFGTGPLVQTPARNYTASQMANFLSDLGLTQAADILRNLERQSLNTAQLGPPPAGLRTLAISSYGVKTSEAYIFSQPFTPGFTKPPSETREGDGDGTVNLASLRLARGWPQHDGTERRVLELDGGVSHFEMLKDQRVLQAVKDFIMNVSSMIEPPGTLD